MTKYSKAHIVEHISNKLISVAVQKEPWPHYIIDEFLPESYYRLLKESFPFTEKIWMPLAHPDNNKGCRQVIYLRRGEESSIKQRKEIWLELYDILDQEVSNVLLTLFELNKYRHKVNAEVQIIHDRTGYKISPHCDAVEGNAHKLLTLLIYFPFHENLTEYGTEMYIREESNEFKTVKKTPFVDNTALIFHPVWDLTWHGVSRIDDQNVNRNSLQIFFKEK
ncbi:MAG: 2OG-Fe(II) oxygenase [Gammaproteobacteria bacterium]|nr:2OG-Fe(II) oxygenase [Gammaproteobacteria bacterium]